MLSFFSSVIQELFGGLTLGGYVLRLFIYAGLLIENIIYGDFGGTFWSMLSLIIFYIPAVLFVVAVVFIVSLIRKHRRKAKDKDTETET